MGTYRYLDVLMILLILICLTSLGCQHTISEAVRQQAEPLISFEALRKNPEAFEGRTVILGGDILKTENAEQQTSIEILQKPLDRFETPKITDQTAGRFIAQCETYLDPAVYDKGRQITIAGKVLGRVDGQVGEAAYLYPAISCIELHLWPPVGQELAYPPYPYFYDPFLSFPYRYYHRPRYYRHGRYR